MEGWVLEMKRLYSVLLTLPLLLTGCKESGSVGIIGGADGPTAIIVSTSSDQLILDLILLIVLFAAVLLWIRYRRNKRKISETK